MSQFGQPRRHVAECASTNDLARAWAADACDPAPHGALVTAAFQTRGRGRRGHHWEAAPAQSALMSFVLRPHIPLTDAWHLGYLTALATAEALGDIGLDPRLKWPNDVLLSGSKVAGILVETVLAPPMVGFAVAGIGLNVNQRAFDAAGFAYPPTSLRCVTGQDYVVEAVVEAVAGAFERMESSYREQGFASILAAWRRRLAVGATVRRGNEAGTLIGLSADGAAIVRLAHGTFAEWTALH